MHILGTNHHTGVTQDFGYFRQRSERGDDKRLYMRPPTGLGGFTEDRHVRARFGA